MAFAPKHLIPLVLLPATLVAQQAQRADTVQQTPAPMHAPHYGRNMVLGFMSSILLHEAAHVVTALSVGAHPHFGFDKGRPTIYSGLSAQQNKHDQFLFSSAGLNAQAILDESILDVPHSKGSAFERGVLLGGISTAFFYATIGRNASNSDITFMARTSSLSKTQASLIYAGLAAIHTVRIARDGHYANFFLRPGQTQGMRVGVAILAE